ncbi:MAG: hypothetical protein K2Q18_07935 [Bdellovibrionales bacterium]|nr:hypothetical protein [Bdellovibrionales bacterium]
MKMFFALIALCSVQAMASSTDLKKGDLTLTAAKAEIVSVKEICPSMPGRLTCMAYGSKVTLKVSLNGCADRLGGFSSKFEVIDGKGVLYFNAINIANEISLRARCIQQSFKLVEIFTPFEGEIELVNLEFTGTNSSVK